MTEFSLEELPYKDLVAHPANLSVNKYIHLVHLEFFVLDLQSVFEHIQCF